VAVRQMSVARRQAANHRAWLSVACGVLAVAAVPVAIWTTRKLPGTELLDAAWAIPVGFLLAIAALLFARGAHGTIARRLERIGGAGWIRLGRVLAVAGLCLAASSSIAVGVYELLLRLEG
jgi:hypothetical protein